MKKTQKHLITLIIFCITAITIGSISQPVEAMGAAPAETQKKTEQPAQTGDDPYSQPVVALTTLDCAQCHESVFNIIRDKGGNVAYVTKHSTHIDLEPIGRRRSPTAILVTVNFTAASSLIV